MSFVLWCMGLATPGEERKDRVLENLESTVTGLRTAGVKLTDADFEPVANDEPPAAVTAAGPEFVTVWREYRRAMALKKKLLPQPQRGKNVLEQSGEYGRLVGELLDGANPPTPEQIAQFFYSDYSWCGTDSGTFASANQQAILLACLRHRRFGEAVEMLLNSTGSAKLRAELLTALGFDSRKIVVGAWLDGRYGMLENLCKDGTEEMARLVLRWAELHWDEAVAKREEDKRLNVARFASGPQLPALELLTLLGEDNAVTPATKERIAAFLHANAIRLYDADAWLQKPPPGAAQWLKPIARAALQHERNEVRKLGEKVLRDAGEPDAKTELRPSARYRLFVNGLRWPQGMPDVDYRQLGLDVKYRPGGRSLGLATSADPDREGVITTDPDHFTPAELVRGAHFYAMPNTLKKPASPAEPWIRAELPLPPAFGQTTDIRIETVEVTIAPHFPRPAQDYDASVTEVGFTWSEVGRQPDENSHVYHLTGRGPLVLEQVQPGEFWLRVRAPGAGLGRWEKIEVTMEKTRFEPKLEIGAGVSVPLKWPEQLQLESLDPDLADFFRSSWWAGLPGFFTVERDGKDFPEAAPEKALQTDDQKREFLLLRNLPVGKYRVRLHSSAAIRAGLKYVPKPERDYAGWKAGEVSFEVNARSPRKFTTGPLKIELAP